MRLINRRAGKGICIGDDTKISVLGVKGTEVKIGVVAPSEALSQLKPIKCKKTRIRCGRQMLQLTSRRCSISRNGASPKQVGGRLDSNAKPRLT